MLAILLVELAASVVVGTVAFAFSWQYPLPHLLEGNFTLSDELAWIKRRLARTFTFGCASLLMSFLDMLLLSDGHLRFLFAPVTKLASCLTVLGFALFGSYLANFIRLRTEVK